MANHKSSVKRAKQTIKKALINKRRRGNVRTTIKALRAAIAEKNKETAEKLYPVAQSLLAAIGQTSAMEKKKASRTTSRLKSQVNQL